VFNSPAYLRGYSLSYGTAPIPAGWSNGTGPVRVVPQPNPQNYTLDVEGYVALAVPSGLQPNSSFNITLWASDGTTTQTETVPVVIPSLLQASLLNGRRRVNSGTCRESEAPGSGPRVGSVRSRLTSKRSADDQIGSGDTPDLSDQLQLPRTTDRLVTVGHG
jgi:hypothetical protein